MREQYLLELAVERYDIRQKNKKKTCALDTVSTEFVHIVLRLRFDMLLYIFYKMSHLQFSSSALKNNDKNEKKKTQN